MQKLSLVLVALAALVGVYGECPNACSGHGTCSLHDQCECCRNFGGADCSERICPFGNAHVDTPKGDIDGSTGTLSGPSTLLIEGSNVYPFGTTEQYPDLDRDEGHAYMECSNKGLCNRDEGMCECFPGYDGTACQRASCPNDCSGHGTCETIKELAEDKENGDVAVNMEYTAGMSDLSGVGNLKYELWDKALTMGCKCDPGFTGPDCSLKLCRYGVDPLFIPSTHNYSPVMAIEDDMLSPSAPKYEKAFVEIIAKDYGDYAPDASGTKSDASQMSGNFDLVIYDVYGEKYVLDKLKYAHYDEVAAGFKTYKATGDPANGPFTGKAGVKYGSNHTTCEEIMSYFPNGKIKDTTMGSFQNQMKHRGGLVSSAYVSGTTKPFCSISSPHGQNITGGGITVRYQGLGDGVMSILQASVGELQTLTVADVQKVRIGDIITTVGLATADNGNFLVSHTLEAGANSKIFLTDMNGGTPAAWSADTGAGSGKKFDVAGMSGRYGTSYSLTGEMSGVFGIRYNFDYNRGNPGYHKDLYVENVIPELGGPNGRNTKGATSVVGSGAYVPVTAYYGVIQQGEVAEYKGDQADDRPATSYDVTLPGYLTDIVPNPDCVAGTPCVLGDVLTFSTDLSSYLYGLNDHQTYDTSASPTVDVSRYFTPDHKTNKIKILNRYYMVADTKRILVTAESAARSDYEIGEYDAATNATLGRFVTQATLISDTDLVSVYAEYWKAAGVAVGQGTTCTCSATPSAVTYSVGPTVTPTNTGATDDFLTVAAGTGAKVRAGMRVQMTLNKISAGTYVKASSDPLSVTAFPETGTKIFLTKAVAGDPSGAAIPLVDDTVESGGQAGCLDCMHNLPVAHEETANAATSGYIYNGRVDFSELNKVYKSVENTQLATGCEPFMAKCFAAAATGTLLTCESNKGIKVGMTVDGSTNVKIASGEYPTVVAVSRVASAGPLYVITLDIKVAADFLTGAREDVKFVNGRTTNGGVTANYDSRCRNGFDSMVNGKLLAGTDGYTPDVKLTVKAKLHQPFQYVSECSNRGACDRETGMCKCFTGYTHDNCDTQSPVC